MVYDIPPYRISHIAFIFISILLSTASFQRTGVYKDEFSLWTDAAGKSSSKARPHNNLGRAYEKMEKIDEAAREFRYAVQIAPYYAPAHSNLASIYIKEKRWDDAENELKLAIAHGPPFEDLHRRLGFVYIKKGLIDDAIKEFEKAKVLTPNHHDARRNIAAIYTEEGFSYTDAEDFTKALILHKIAFSIDPDYPNSHYGLALDYEAMGQKEPAIKHWQEYLKLAPRDEPFRNDAIRHLEKLQVVGER